MYLSYVCLCTTCVQVLSETTRGCWTPVTTAGGYELLNVDVGKPNQVLYNTSNAYNCLAIFPDPNFM